MRVLVDSLGEVIVTTAEGMTLTVGEVRASARFEARVAGGELVGYIICRHSDGVTFLVHTVIEPVWRGRGIAAAMAPVVLDLIHRAGRWVVPRCPFVGDFIAGHEELLGLVPEQHRHLVKPAFHQRCSQPRW